VCNEWDAADIDQRFGPDAFDVGISTELLEHAREWQKIIHNFKYVLRPGGVLVVTTRSYGVDFHRQPHDFWRYEKDDFELIFSDLAGPQAGQLRGAGSFRAPAVFDPAPEEEARGDRSRPRALRDPLPVRAAPHGSPPEALSARGSRGAASVSPRTL
jgi:SAM-dependent methyltransferase